MNVQIDNGLVDNLAVVFEPKGADSCLEPKLSVEREECSDLLYLDGMGCHVWTYGGASIWYDFPFVVFLCNLPIVEPSNCGFYTDLSV